LVAAAEALLEERPPDDVLVIAGGCDAMRRMGDLLAAYHPERTFVLAVPRASTEHDVRAFAAELVRLEQWLKERAVQTADAAATPTASATTGAAALGAPDYPSAPEPGGVFVVGGPMSDDSLLELLSTLGAKVAGLESCTFPDRWQPLATAGLDALPSDLSALAGQVLQLAICPRFSTTLRKAHLARRLEQTKASCVIYARQSFCDPGAYDALLVAELAAERGLPFLELEVGFPLEASGPLRTRVEAFLEAQLLDEDILGGDFLDDDLLGGDELLAGDLLTSQREPGHLPEPGPARSE